MMLKVGRYLSPVEVQERRFDQKFRGYDIEEVDDFLLHLGADYEALYKENQDLREQVESLQEELGKYKRLEENVQAALVTAQEAAKSVQENAQAEGKLIIQEARFQAEQEKQKARMEVAQAAEKLSALKYESITFKSQLRALLASFQELVEMKLEPDHRLLEVAAAREEEDDCSGGDSSLPEESSEEGESGPQSACTADFGENGDPQSTARFSIDSFNSTGHK
jgi:cell division initiation protein